MRNFTRLIPEEDVQDFVDWQFGEVDAAKVRQEQLAREKARQEDLARLEEFRQSAFAEGVEHGRNQTLLEAQQRIDTYVQGQGQEAARQMAALLAQLDESWLTAEKTAAEEVLDLACVIARQVVRQELSVNPNAVQPVVREALATLFAENKPATVRLHPLDLDLMQDTLQAEFPNLTIHLQADPTLTRGGCVVESGGTVIDATVEQRWQRAIQRLARDLPWGKDEEAGDAL